MKIHVTEDERTWLLRAIRSRGRVRATVNSPYLPVLEQLDRAGLMEKTLTENGKGFRFQITDDGRAAVRGEKA